MAQRKKRRQLQIEEERQKSRENDTAQRKRQRQLQTEEERQKSREENTAQRKKQRQLQIEEERQKSREENTAQKKRQRARQHNMYCTVLARYKQMLADREHVNQERQWHVGLVGNEKLGIHKSRDPRKQYWLHVLQISSYCDCCNSRRLMSSLFAMPSSHKLDCYHGLKFIAGKTYFLCRACQLFKADQTHPVCPRSAVRNALAVPEMPACLSGLGYMETQAIRLVHPFQTILNLPHGQHGAKGQVIHLPSLPSELTSHLLPHPPDACSMVAIMQEYDPRAARGMTESASLKDMGDSRPSFTYSYSASVNTITQALTYLKEHNHLYYNQEMYSSLEVVEMYGSEKASDINIDVFDSFGCFNMDGELDTVIIPEDVVLPIHAPLRTFPTTASQPIRDRDEYVEEKSFPHLYPTGKFGETHHDRPSKLTVRDYYKLRALSYDNRYQADPCWIFRALNIVQRADLYKRIYYILHQQKAQVSGETKLTAATFLQHGSLRSDQDESTDNSASHILNSLYPTVGSCIRGSSAYFNQARRHLETMVTNLGAPFMFLTFSLSTDNPELFMFIDRRKFPTPETVETLTEEERAAILNAHPVDAAEFYFIRMKAIISYICSDAKPLGERVTDYFVKTEKQRSGQLHGHLVTWLEDQPDVNTSQGRARALEIARQVISAELPDKDQEPELHYWVKRCQYHRHTFTCQKGNNSKSAHVRHRNIMRSRVKNYDAQDAGIECSDKIAESDTDEDLLSEESEDEIQDDCEHHTNLAIKSGYKNQAIRQKCRFGFPHPRSETTHLRTEQETRFLVKGDRELVMKRSLPDSEWVNNYVPDLLLKTRSNMDVQIIFDHRAILAYLISYTTKGEKEERETIAQALVALPENASKFNILSKIGNAILSHRQVSKPEAAYILLGHPLYFSSRSTIYLNTRPPHKRARCLKNRRDLELLEDDSEDVFTSNIFIRYQSRPVGLPFDDMTLIEFAQWFMTSTEGHCSSGMDDNEPSENQDADLVDSDNESDADIGADNTHQGSLPVDTVCTPNPKWRTSPCEPPFMPAPRNRKQPRFYTTTKPPQLLRQRLHARCISINHAQADTLDGMYSAVVAHVPFRNELLDLFGQAIIEPTFSDVLNVFKMYHEIITANSSRTANKFSELVRKAAEYIDELSAVEKESGFARVSGLDPDIGIDSDIPADTAQLIHMQHNSTFELEEESNAQTKESRQWNIFRDIHDQSTEQSGQLARMVSALTKEQYQIYKKIRQYLHLTRKFENEMAKWERIQKDNINLPHWLQHPHIPVPVPPAPPRLFVSGPGGVGKSFLINTLRLLVQVWAAEDPTRPRANGGILVCAPTGVASFNISASTIVEKAGRSTFKYALHSALRA